MPKFSIFTLGLILLTASLVAMISRRFKLPYSVGLVIAGIVLALVPSAVEFPLTRDLIFNIFLPPLVFEAALQLEWKAFRRDLPLTVGLAFVGVTIAAAFVAAGMHFAIGWSWIGAGLFWRSDCGDRSSLRHRCVSGNEGHAALEHGGGVREPAERRCRRRGLHPPCHNRRRSRL